VSDGNLLIFGCAVTFIAVAGAYVYLRERYMEHERPREAPERRAEAASRRARSAA
jgi:hypothetical protein